MKKTEIKSMPRLIIRIGHHLKVRMDEKLSQNNLTISQFKVLAYLWEHSHKKINQKHIHEFLEIKPSSLNKLLSLLETKGLIKKEIDPDDFRNRIIKLTDHGMEIKRICTENMKQTEAYVLEEFSDEEVNILFNLLSRMKKKIS